MIYDLVILGAGPAGLAASVYAARKNLEFVTVAETLGGRATQRVSIPGVPEHRATRPDELVAAFRHELEYLHERYRQTEAAEVRRGEGETRYTLQTADGGEPIEARTVIVATGARVRRLGVPGEEKYLGRGLGYSAISYSHLLGGRSVFIYGDGPQAARAALEAARHAGSVTLAMQRDAASVPAQGAVGRQYRDKLEDTGNLRVLYDCAVTAFDGDTHCRAVEIERAEGGRERIEADACFLELCPEPNSEPAAGVAELDPDRYIVVDRGNRTSAAGVFAAGDVTAGAHAQSLSALGAGVSALLSAYEYLI